MVEEAGAETLLPEARGARLDLDETHVGRRIRFEYTPVQGAPELGRGSGSCWKPGPQEVQLRQFLSRIHHVQRGLIGFAFPGMTN